MPTNIEIKARARDVDALAARVRAIADSPGETLEQRDTFFRCSDGRLKLRETGTGRSELIWYRREDTAGSKRSEYLVMPVADPASLRGLLDRAFGTVQVVRKSRRLFLVGQTRIHLDQVEGLGIFMELEVVLHDGQPDSEGHAIAADLMRRLGIAPDDLVEGAYADLLAAGRDGESRPRESARGLSPGRG
mgnify:FL=1